jgi:hypothetical protein
MSHAPMPKNYQVLITAEAKVASALEAEGRKAGKSRRKGWFQRIKIGAEAQRGRPGKLAIVERLMKRVGFGDWYSEKVIDHETGNLLHECEHPFSEHQGHGSAKQKRSNGDRISN